MYVSPKIEIINFKDRSIICTSQFEPFHPGEGRGEEDFE